MFRIPQGGMLGQGRIRMGVEVCTQVCVLIGWNAGCRSRTWGRGKRASGRTARKPAFDGREADPKGTYNIGTRHAGIKRVKDACA